MKEVRKFSSNLVKETKSVRQIFISVLITAYKREEFIIDAVKSVLNQTLNRDFFEVIVAKSFMQKKIDEFLLKNKINSIYVDDNRYGYRLTKAIETSKGNIIVTLDDDDLFLPHFLEKIYRVLSEKNDLNAYQKSFAYFDNNGIFLLKKRSKSLKFTKYSNLIYNLGTKKGYDLAISLDATYGQLVVEKNVLLPYMAYLEKVKTSLDTMLFVVCTLEKCKVFYDYEVSTIVRTHRDSESMIGNKQLDRKFFQRKYNSIKKLLADYELFLLMADEYNNNRLKGIINEFKNDRLLELSFLSPSFDFNMLVSMSVNRIKSTILKFNRKPLDAVGGYLLYNYFLLLKMINPDKGIKSYYYWFAARFEKAKIPLLGLESIYNANQRRNKK